MAETSKVVYSSSSQGSSMAKRINSFQLQFAAKTHLIAYFVKLDLYSMTQKNPKFDSGLPATATFKH